MLGLVQNYVMDTTEVLLLHRKMGCLIEKHFLLFIFDFRL